jgi:hypothetical protein
MDFGMASRFRPGRRRARGRTGDKCRLRIRSVAASAVIPDEFLIFIRRRAVIAASISTRLDLQRRAAVYS